MFGDNPHMLGRRNGWAGSSRTLTHPTALIGYGWMPLSTAKLVDPCIHVAHGRKLVARRILKLGEADDECRAKEDTPSCTSPR